MNTGVEILLKRMADCPEDFNYLPHTGGMSRWSRLVDHAIGEELLTEEEHDALMAGLKEVKRVRFTELVMKELAGEGETDDPKSNPNQATSVMGLGGATQGGYTLTANGNGQVAWANTATTTTTAQLQANSLTIGQTQLQEAQLKAMLEEVKARQKVREEPKKSKTLFGKLHKYFVPL